MSILDPINNLVAWVIKHIYAVLSPTLGATSGLTWVLSIAILVVGMRLILLPLFIKQMHTQRAMTALTPRINEIRKKYKGDKEKLNAETMKLYQEAGVNPLMGCLPILLQMPLFFALFSVLREIAEWKPGVVLKYTLTTAFVSNVSKADIFGVQIKDTFLHATSWHVRIVVALVILVSMGTTYLTVRQSMKRGMMPTGSDNPMGQSQKMMAYIMPLFALTGLYWPFGLVLYWVMTNVWTLGQQYVLLRRYPVGAAAAMTGGNMPVGKSPVKPATASGLTGGPAKPKRLSSPPAGAAGSGNGTSNGKPAAGKKVQDAKPTGAAASASANGAASPNGSAADGSAADGTAGNETASNGGASNGGASSRSASNGGAANGGAANGGASNGGASNGSTSSRSPGKSAASKSPASKSAASKSAASKSPASKSPASQSGAAKGTGSNSNGVSANGGKTSANGAKATRSAASSETPAPAAVTNGHKPAGEEGGMLRRFSRNRPEPEPLAPEEPETKIVRQQPQRQSRSKRSGKR